MHSRREFIKRATILSGAAGVFGALPASIRAAMAIEPAPGSTYLDAEHVVILMQENRSFDHCFGSLRGVRGFNDPRAMTLAGGNPVWAQTGPDHKAYTPFRLNLHGTRSTWMGSLPHSWTDQVDAANGGKHDGWLAAKHSGNSAYRDMPLTMGYYTREDIPFYYALADAFTVCDQHFCSSLTGTTPNRLYLWSGTIRGDADSPHAPANTRNENVDYGRWANWTTFPERLEDLGVSWKIYQNEISLDSGLHGEEDAWLANFTDNPIEWFEQYQVRFARTHREHVLKRMQQLPKELAVARQRQQTPGISAKEADAIVKRIAEIEREMKDLSTESVNFTDEAWEKLPPRTRSLHEKAFSTNAADPHYRSLADLTYDDNGQQRRLKVPKGDVLHQFRTDVSEGKLPTVSWLVAPERFSDHPGSAWYGAWYLSEVIDILTKNPEVWRKTIFILTYDENDGYFDHVAPFAAPRPGHPETGFVSEGLDATSEYVELDDDLKRAKPHDARGSSIGLGFRVPMIVASPWSRGGCVCSQVFDHTSCLMLLEKLLSHKLGKPVKETNISDWRRAVCGDLTSIFRPASDAAPGTLPFEKRDEVIEAIHKAQFKEVPKDYAALTDEQLATLRAGKRDALPKQEPGTRPACPLPYELAADWRLSPDLSAINLGLSAGNRVFGKQAAGAPFTVHAVDGNGDLSVRHYAVLPGDAIADTWAFSEFGGAPAHLRVFGPNGFYREFRMLGGAVLDVSVTPQVGKDGKPTGVLEVALASRATTGAAGVGKGIKAEIRDMSYGSGVSKAELGPGASSRVKIDTSKSGGWYDVAVTIEGDKVFACRYAGKIETGAWTTSDPAMG
ncbi:MAG: phospholipase C, phosphocholine-specific [Tepidisphaera sp.]|nr:phospholipase C, phosphocholine-specific [Tepidisphaera sp.]